MTWENGFLTDRWELHQDNGELIAVVEPTGKIIGKRKEWGVYNRVGTLVAARLILEDAQSVAAKL